jgi:hypothetical protein
MSKTELRRDFLGRPKTAEKAPATSMNTHPAPNRSFLI